MKFDALSPLTVPLSSFSSSKPSSSSSPGVLTSTFVATIKPVTGSLEPVTSTYAPSVRLATPVPLGALSSASPPTSKRVAALYLTVTPETVRVMAVVSIAPRTPLSSKLISTPMTRPSRTMTRTRCPTLMAREFALCPLTLTGARPNAKRCPCTVRLERSALRAVTVPETTWAVALTLVGSVLQPTVSAPSSENADIQSVCFMVRPFVAPSCFGTGSSRNGGNCRRFWLSQHYNCDRKRKPCDLCLEVWQRNQPFNRRFNRSRPR